MVTLCRCPDCGLVVDARIGEFGEVRCPGCKGWFWIPRNVFDTAPFAGRTRGGCRIVDVSFDFMDGYVITYLNGYSKFLIGRSYDPFTGYWRDQRSVDDCFGSRRR